MTGSHDCRAAVALDPQTQLVLWGLRVHAAGMRMGVPVSEPVRATFAQAMAEDAAGPLEALVVFIGRGAARTVEVKCPQCPDVTADERLLLRLLALYQAGRDLPALFEARGLLTPAAARVSGPVFRMAATALAQCGLRLTDETLAAPMPLPFALIMPEHATIH